MVKSSIHVDNIFFFVLRNFNDTELYFIVWFLYIISLKYKKTPTFSFH